jgi:membrane-bound lytic murein transglycosylase B
MPLRLSRRWPLRQLIAASSLILLVACAEKPTAADAQPLQTLPVATAPAVIPPVVPADENLDIQPTQTFAEWQAGFRKEALAAGIRADIFDRAFANVSFDESVIRADRSQPEFARPVWEYLDGALSPLRVRKGQSLVNQYADILQSIEQR